MERVLLNVPAALCMLPTSLPSSEVLGKLAKAIEQYIVLLEQRINEHRPLCKRYQSQVLMETSIQAELNCMK